MLSECRCNLHISKQSVFKRVTSNSRSTKRRCSHRRGTFSDVEYLEATANMANKNTEKQPAVSSDESDAEPEGVYCHTRTRTGAVAPINYSALAWGIDVSESHSAIVESQALNSSIEKEAFVHMAGTPEEMAICFEQ